MNWDDFKKVHEDRLIKAIHQNAPELKNKEITMDWDIMKLKVDGVVYPNDNFTIQQIKKINAAVWPDCK